VTGGGRTTIEGNMHNRELSTRQGACKPRSDERRVDGDTVEVGESIRRWET
jgi:hypothetical protein